MMTLILPDGSAIASQFVGAITWEKSRQGQYGSPAFLRIYQIKNSGDLGFSSKTHLEQIHYLPMESDEAAKTACEALVAAWSGKALAQVEA